MIGTLMFNRTLSIAPLEGPALSFAIAGTVSIVLGLLIILAIGLARHRVSARSSDDANLGPSFGVDREAA